MKKVLLFGAAVSSIEAFGPYGTVPSSSRWALGATKQWIPADRAVAQEVAGDVSPKTVTKEIMNYFQNGGKMDEFRQRLSQPAIRENLDGMHMITILFQSARSRKKITDLVPLSQVMATIQAWDRSWTERDISTFLYGIRALNCISAEDSEFLKLAATKINESTAYMSSRAIGNALYGLQDITSDFDGIPELIDALATKIEAFTGDLDGQDMGIGLYGIQGLSADVPEVRRLVSILADKIESSVTELDEQAMGNLHYGLQSLSSDHPEVLKLVSALAAKVAESDPQLSSQAIGTALYGLQKLSSDPAEVKVLLAALTDKVITSQVTLDAQAIGNSLQGLQSMKSNNVEVRNLLSAIRDKITQDGIELDSKSVGEALYGLNSMSSDVPQVRQLLMALSQLISKSEITLDGQEIADALYGLRSMTTDCPELRSLLSALGSKIDAKKGKLESYEIANALNGLQGLSSDMYEVRLIVSKLADKLQRSKATLTAANIGRALLGLQRFSGDSSEVRYLLKQITRLVARSDRVRLTSSTMADATFGLQGMSSDVPEVQLLVGELAKKIAATAAPLRGAEVGRALFGLQCLSSSPSIFAESAVGIDSDEVLFLISALWDKLKVNSEPMALSAIAQGLQGITLLRDPIAQNIRKYLYAQVVRLGAEPGSPQAPTAEELEELGPSSDLDVVRTVRALRFNGLAVPKWIKNRYALLEEKHPEDATVLQSRADKLVCQKYRKLHKDNAENMVANALMDGVRLDMHFPDIQLNVELDGPTHMYPARARYDQQRDEYVMIKCGLTVARVQLLGKSIEEVVAMVDKAVTAKKTKLEDEQIQSLYAKNSAAETFVQSIYKKEE
jgi:very-short-patch-repair endonuclease